MKVRSLLQGHLNEDDYADCISAATAAKSLQSCPTLCDPMDCSPPGSSVHGIFQARVLEWGAIAFSARQSLVPCLTCFPFFFNPFCFLGRSGLYTCLLDTGREVSSVSCTLTAAHMGPGVQNAAQPSCLLLPDG